jgi:hypothetical protein
MTSETGEAPAAPPARINLAEEFAQSGVGPVLQQLDDELIGLAPVKQRIREIAALLLVDRVRRKFGLTSQAPTLHMSSAMSGAAISSPSRATTSSANISATPRPRPRKC